MLRVCAFLVAALLAAGCGDGDPPQPKLTDEQIKETMKQGQEQSIKERGNRGPGGVPIR